MRETFEKEDPELILDETDHRDELGDEEDSDDEAELD